MGEVFLPPANTSSVEWIGYVRGKDWGLFIEAFLQMTFGGIPWQVLTYLIMCAKNVIKSENVHKGAVSIFFVRCVAAILIFDTSTLIYYYYFQFLILKFLVFPVFSI